MVEIVSPLRIEPDSASLRRRDQARVVQIALSDQIHRAPQLTAARVHRFRKLLQERVRGFIVDRVDGVEPEGVYALFARPHGGGVPRIAENDMGRMPRHKCYRLRFARTTTSRCYSGASSSSCLHSPWLGRCTFCTARPEADGT